MKKSVLISVQSILIYICNDLLSKLYSFEKYKFFWPYLLPWQPFKIHRFMKKIVFDIFHKLYQISSTSLPLEDCDYSPRHHLSKVFFAILPQIIWVIKIFVSLWILCWHSPPFVGAPTSSVFTIWCRILIKAAEGISAFNVPLVKLHSYHRWHLLWGLCWEPVEVEPH